MRYEIHCNVKGKWVLDSLFDDRTLALDEAHGLVTRGKARAGLKVIEDVDDKTPPRTIFFYSAAAIEKMEAAKKHRQVVKEVEAAREERKAKKDAVRAAEAIPKKTSGTMIALRLALILVGGIAALQGLRMSLLE
jgi:hypothetical protein